MAAPVRVTYTVKDIVGLRWNIHGYGENSETGVRDAIDMAAAILAMTCCRVEKGYMKLPTGLVAPVALPETLPTAPMEKSFSSMKIILRKRDTSASQSLYLYRVCHENLNNIGRLDEMHPNVKAFIKAYRSKIDGVGDWFITNSWVSHGGKRDRKRS